MQQLLSVHHGREALSMTGLSCLLVCALCDSAVSLVVSRCSLVPATGKRPALQRIQ